MTDTVLARMTAGIAREAAVVMARKGSAAAKLTPVEGESAQTVAEIAGLAVPKDIPGALLAREGMEAAVIDLRRLAGDLLAAAHGIEVLLGVPAAVAEDAVKRAVTDDVLAKKEEVRRAEDRVAAADGDARAAKRVDEATDFDAKLAAKAAAAQAATFEADGWACPDHGSQRLVTLTATKSKRVYAACAVGECEEFEPKPEVAA